MNLLQVKGNWNVIKGKFKQRIARLTHDDRRFFEGKADELVGRIQQRTGRPWRKSAVAKPVNPFFKV